MLSSKSKIYFLLAVFLVLSSLLGVFAVRPFLVALNEKSKELGVFKEQLIVLEEQLAILRNFQDKNSVYQKSISSIESAVVAWDAPIDFMEFLEYQAGILNLSLSVYPAALEKDVKFHTSFRIVVEGPFDKCLSFLARLERSQWLVEISGADINRFSEMKGNNKEASLLKVGDVSMSLMVKALRMAQPSSNQGGDGSLSNEGT